MRKFERDLRDELEAHIAHRADDLVRTGLPRDEAMRRARVEFGSFEACKEQLRDERRLAWLRRLPETLWIDLRYGIRRLRKAPLFVAFAIASLAIGLGVITAAYSLVQAVVWPQIGIPDTQRLAIVGVRSTRGVSWRPVMSAADFAELRRQQSSFASLAGSATAYHYLTDDAVALGARAESVTGNYFQTLGVAAQLGRTLLPSDDDPAAPGVIVISDFLWQTKLDADPNVIGRIVRLAGEPVEIVGVMPRVFGGLTRLTGRRADIWVSWSMTSMSQDDPARRVAAVARLQKPGGLDAAAAEIATIAMRLDEVSPLRNETAQGSVLLPRKWTAAAFDEVRWRSIAPGTPAGAAIVALFGLILAVASTNLANMTLARGAVRQTEVRMRRALGASRARLVRELTLESVLIGLAGGAAALFTADWLLTIVSTEISLFGTTLADMFDPRLDLSTYLFAATAVTAALVVFGLMPAIRLTRHERTTMLVHESSPAGVRWSGQRHLIRVQVAVSLLLLLTAAFCVAVVAGAARHDPGFDLDRIVMANVGFDAERRDPVRAEMAAQAVLDELARDPLFERAGVTSGLPSSSATFAYVGPAGRPDLLSRDSVVLAAASPGLLETLGVPILHGRSIDERDTAASPLAAVLNASLAKTLFGTTDAAGREFLLETLVQPGARTSLTVAGKLAGVPAVRADSPNAPRARQQRTAVVVGIAGDTSVEWGRLDRAVVYVPLAQLHETPRRIVARPRADLDDDAAVMALRTAVRRASPDLAVTAAGTDEQVLAPEQAAMRVASILAGALGLFALALTAIGLYGVLSHIVVRRTRELCLRLALGATPAQVLRLVMRDGLRPVLSGAAIGLVLAVPIRIAAHDALDEFLPIEPYLFAGVMIVFLACGAAACYWPARRAANVDPNVALKEL
jgi:putative ABC transport system permease protein